MSLLAHAIFAEGLKNLAAGASGVDLKRGLDRGLTAAVTALRGQSRPVSSTREKAQVATISAHNDPALGDFVATAMDRVGGVLECVAVKAPGYGDRRRIAEATNDDDREKLGERLAKRAGGVAIIRVGAPTEAELKNRREALDDAISATRAAIAEGTVPGGGLALVRVIDAVEKEAAACEGDERTGIRILARALEVPARTIAENSAADGGVVVGDLRRSGGSHGFDAARGVFCDLVEAGIIDPTKVVRAALENAVSVAGTLLLTEATLTEVKDEKDELHRPALAAEL